MDVEKAKQLTSPCGLPCFHCPAFMAKDNPAIRKQMAAAFHLPEEKAFCEGCRPLEGKIKLLKPDQQCRVYSCAQERHIDFCNQCDEFPCERFQPYADKAQFPHNTKMYQLCMMKKLGFEKWAEEEAVRIWDIYRTKPFDFDNILY